MEGTPPDYDYENVEDIAMVVPLTGREYYLVSDGEFYWSLSGDAVDLGFFASDEDAIDAWHAWLPYDLTAQSPVVTRDDWGFEFPEAPPGYEWSDELDAYYDPTDVVDVPNEGGFDIWRVGDYYYLNGAPDSGKLIGRFDCDQEAVEATLQSVDSERQLERVPDKQSPLSAQLPVSVEEITPTSTDDASLLAYATTLLPCVLKVEEYREPDGPAPRTGAVVMGWSEYHFASGSMYNRKSWVEPRVAFAAAVVAQIESGEIQLAWLVAGEAAGFALRPDLGYRSVMKSLSAAPSVGRWVLQSNEITDELADPSRPWLDDEAPTFELSDPATRSERIRRFNAMVKAQQIVIPMPLPCPPGGTLSIAGPIDLRQIVPALARLGRLRVSGELSQPRPRGQSLRMRGLLAAEAIVLAATAAAHR